MCNVPKIYVTGAIAAQSYRIIQKIRKTKINDLCYRFLIDHSFFDMSWSLVHTMVQIDHDGPKSVVTGAMVIFEYYHQ